MRFSQMDFKNPIDEEDGWKLLEGVTINDRSLIAYYNPNDNIISLVIFHLTEQPNELSKRSMYTTWGYVTHAITAMHTCEEAAEVVGLYLQDIENDSCWWEND